MCEDQKPVDWFRINAMLSLTHSPAGDACWAVSFLLQNPPFHLAGTE